MDPRQEFDLMIGRNARCISEFNLHASNLSRLDAVDIQTLKDYAKNMYDSSCKMINAIEEYYKVDF